MTQQILVFGAGIAGLATAVALQRRGHDVTVIEERTDTATPYERRAAGSRPEPCAGATARGCVTPPGSGWSRPSVSRWW